MSHILLTYHVEILDLLTVTNCIRQNLTANFSASLSCTLELPSGILSPYMVKMQLVHLMSNKGHKVPYHSHILLLLNHVVSVVKLYCVEGLM